MMQHFRPPFDSAWPSVALAPHPRERYRTLAVIDQLANERAAMSWLERFERSTPDHMCRVAEIL